MNFSLTAVDYVICIVTLSASVALGLYLAVRAHAGQTSEGFFLAGRKLTWPIVGASLFATNIGAEHLVGLSGDAYRYGLSAGSNELTTSICIGLAAAVLYPYFIKNHVFTIPEYLELRYNRTARVFFSGLMLVICIMTKMAFHLFAGAMVLRGLLGWDVMPVIVLVGAVVATVTIIGGFTAVAYTDSIQTAIMILGCGLMLLVGLDKIGGWHALLAKAPQAMHLAQPYDDPNYPFWGIIAASAYGGIFYWGLDQVNVQRVLGARDLRQARWGAMFTILLKMTPTFIFALPGVIAFVLYPGREAKTTFVTLLNELLPSGARGLVLAALLASLIASNLSVMNSISTLVVRDFIMHFRPRTSERGQVLFGRLAILGGAALGIAAAYLIFRTPEGLYKYLIATSIYLTLPITPAIVFGILSKRVNMQGAVASVAVGSILSAIFVTDQLLGVDAGSRLFPWLHTKLTLNFAYRGLWGSVCVSVVLFFVSWLTPKPRTENLERLTVDWRHVPERFCGWADWRLQWAILSMAAVAIFWTLR